MLRGELYWPWDDDLQANRTRCKRACEEFNTSQDASRRSKVELWRKYALSMIDAMVNAKATLSFYISHTTGIRY